METDEKNRLFSWLMNEISITSGSRERWHGYARLWVTVLLTGALAAFTLSSVAQMAAIVMAGYALLMIYNAHVGERRTGRIEDAMRGLVLQKDFGLYHPERNEKNTFLYLSELISIRRRLLPENIRDLRGDKDIVRIIEQYAE